MPSQTEPTAEALMAKFTSALSEVPIDCAPSEAADALLCLALSVAESCSTKISIARTLMGLAERYMQFADGQQEAAGAEQSSDVIIGHTAISAAIASMRAAGISQDAARLLLLNFVATWLANGDPVAGAEALYRQADILAGRASKIN